MRMRFWMASFLSVAMVGAALADVPVGTGFTYLGRLSQNGEPLNTPVNLTFELYDELVGGNLLGSQALPDTPVNAGLFSVLLNDAGQFGPNAFNGARRWLQVSIGDTIVEPRQEVLPTPYALFALRPWMAADGGVLSYLGGNVGIGTAAPEQPLSVAGVVQSSAGGFMFPDGTVQTSAATGGEGFWSAAGTDIFSNNAGNVGIGTSTPFSRLDVAAAGDGAELLRFSTERPWVFRQTGSGSGAFLQLQSTVGLKQFEITAQGGTNVATFQANDSDPRLGIGTRTPLSRLDIAASGEGAELLRFSTERPWVFRQIYSGPSTGLQLLSTSGLKNFEITASNGANVATFVTDNINPRVGIGTTTPVSRLDIVGQDGLGITGFQPFLTLRDSNAGNARARIQTANGDLAFYTESSFASGVAPLLLRNSGAASVRVLEIRGADVAEKFPTSDKVEPGMVVAIDPEHAGKLCLARGAYNPRVAGIVSGAGDLPAGAILGNLPGQEESPAIALSGRVWAFCDARDAAIGPGDLLTTSDTPGHAMKVVDRERSHGAVIGKAMTALEVGEKGLVLVLVNLQ